MVPFPTKVDIELNIPNEVYLNLNSDFFEWVIENLLKNALDAMDKPQGKIVFDVFDKPSEIIIDISDNGKGIDKQYKKDIFRPGFYKKAGLGS